MFGAHTAQPTAPPFDEEKDSDVIEDEDVISDLVNQRVYFDNSTLQHKWKDF